MQKVQIKGHSRSETGTAGSKKVRHAGMIPAVIYGGDDVKHISVTHAEVKDLVYTPDFKLAEIEIDGQTYTCILKDLQAHPVTDSILHMDFLRLIEGAPVNVEIPVRFKGTSPGVKKGGALVKLLRRVKIRTTPEYLVDELYVDISPLNLGQSIRVKDLIVGEGIAVVNSASIPVAIVEVPRALKSASAGAEDEEGAEETEEVPAEEA
jgi:large subunit ribosomal protein L25